jgi:hypothetical protein
MQSNAIKRSIHSGLICVGPRKEELRAADWHKGRRTLIEPEFISAMYGYRKNLYLTA